MKVAQLILLSNWWRRLLVITIALGLLACSTLDIDPADLPAPLADVERAEVLRELWSAATGSGTKGQFLSLRPLILAGRVIVANADGEVAAYDNTNGEQLWRTATGIVLSGGVGGGDNLVVVGGSEGEVVALNYHDGSELWRVTLSSEVLAAPGVANDIVVVRSVDGRVTGLAARDGARLWVFSRTVPVLTLRGTSAPLSANKQIFVGFDSGHLVALNSEDGRVLWESTIAEPKGRSELERIVDIDADPVLFGNTLYVAAAQGRVVALDTARGQLIWARDIPSRAGIGVDRDHLYLTDEESVVWCLDRNNGTALWRQVALRNRNLTAPTPYGALIVVGDSEGYLHLLAQDDGHLVGRYSLDSSPILTAPILRGALLYALGSRGFLAALRD